jgi:polysaccharide biosynthesis/export protein
MTNTALCLLLACMLAIPVGAAQTSPQPAAAAGEVPADYVIGPEDVLGIVFWREAELSGDVTVRPDGRITLPVIGELVAAGVRPDELQKQIVELASKYINDPNVAVVVRAINSRKFFVTGRVADPGTFDLRSTMTVMQAIAMAGGLTEYANGKNITILRKGNGRTEVLKFNYRDVARGRNLEQDVVLRPGDTVVVP